jgi:ABC-type multidrug transport system ATPase subunit
MTMGDGSAVVLEGVVKRFGSHLVALDGLNLTVASGQVFGLLGPNGAGKTTTMRLILGLMRPTEGKLQVLGRPPGDPVALRRIGAMGDAGFYPFLSGRDNLRVSARRGGVGDGRVDESLELAGLTARANDRFEGYSLGMKQRLGVALALLKDPELLVLDEPTNGLDPIGQLEMQSLIRRLGSDGRTVLLSSHDMHEVEELCGRVAVIGGGRLLFEGPSEQLRGHAALLVRAEPAERAAEVAAGLRNVDGVERTGDLLRLVLRDLDQEQAAGVNRELVDAGIRVSELRSARRPLREVFLEMTGGRSGGSDSIRPRFRRRR